MDKDNKYPFRECISRNVFLLGRTRTGKSTISRVLRNPHHIPELAGLYAEDRNISFNEIATTNESNVYYIKIIDSPGFYDQTINEGERLSNETIKTYINECITKDVTHIHMFAFVFSGGTGINIQDIQSMIFIKQNYPQLQEFFILLITHCEEKDEDERKTFVDQFFKHPDVVRYGLKDFFGLGIYFMGCLRPQLRRKPNTTSAQTQAQNVMKMRQALLDLIVTRDTTFNIHYITPTLFTVPVMLYRGFVAIVAVILFALFISSLIRG
jgi:GTP-binding protein EngB required for normal cell division